jgi:hypothetical protein
MIPTRSCVFACLLSAAVLSGCATPQTRVPEVTDTEYVEEARNQLEFALQREVRDEVRLWNVGAPVLVAGAELCGEKVRPYTGIWALSLWDFGKLYQPAARKLYGLDGRLRIAHMLPDSPAAKAGLAAGDIIQSVGGFAIPRGEGARDTFYGIADSFGSPGHPVEITVSRHGQTLRVPVVPVAKCDYPVILQADDEVNAYADGRAIYVTEGIMRFTESDQHLAVIIGHELAHNVMGHIDAAQQNATVGALGGLLLDIGFLALGGQYGRRVLRGRPGSGGEGLQRGIRERGRLRGALSAGPRRLSARWGGRLLALGGGEQPAIDLSEPDSPHHARALRRHREDHRRDQGEEGG